MYQLGTRASREDQVVGELRGRERLQAEMDAIAELSGRNDNLTQGKLSGIY